MSRPQKLDPHPKRLLVTLPAPLHAAVAARSRRDGKSMAELVRMGLREVLCMPAFVRCPPGGAMGARDD